ncbi:MAG: hypothetical protein CM15mP39_04730 [Synechococcus sp.]|nr:MAG: hypothetical protein CM15mP39_04730 [Synechococcus sp.]
MTYFKAKNYYLFVYNLSGVFVLLFPELLTLGSIQSAVVSAILGGILFVQSLVYKR